jgi:hypothetical protein
MYLRKASKRFSSTLTKGIFKYPFLNNCSYREEHPPNYNLPKQMGAACRISKCKIKALHKHLRTRLAVRKNKYRVQALLTLTRYASQLS